MKKYLIIGIMFLLLLLNSSPSYAQENCDNYLDETLLNTNNLVSYINDNYYNQTINYFCSNDYCYNVNGQSLTESVDNFIIILEKYTLEDIKIEAEIKGYPITKISINQCG